MDVDKSLDDMISDKRKPSGGARGRGGPRTSLPRRENAVPYAVSVAAFSDQSYHARRTGIPVCRGNDSLRSFASSMVVD